MSYSEDYNIEAFDLRVRLARVTRVAEELTDIVRRDATLFKKISPRTKRWIKKQDVVTKARMDAKDEVLRLVRRRHKALAKLNEQELKLLGLWDGPTDD